MQVVSHDELKEDNEYEEIVEDMREECSKYGVLTSLTIPRPNAAGEEVPGTGMVKY
jgi:splicing factor U2AF subunit